MIQPCLWRLEDDLMPLSFNSQHQVFSSADPLSAGVSSETSSAVAAGTSSQKSQSNQTAVSKALSEDTMSRRAGIFEKRSSLLNPMDLIPSGGSAPVRKSKKGGRGNDGSDGVAERTASSASSRSIAGNFKHSIVQVCEEIRPVSESSILSLPKDHEPELTKLPITSLRLLTQMV